MAALRQDHWNELPSRVSLACSLASTRGMFKLSLARVVSAVPSRLIQPFAIRGCIHRGSYSLDQKNFKTVANWRLPLKALAVLPRRNSHCIQRSGFVSIFVDYWQASDDGWQAFIFWVASYFVRRYTWCVGCFSSCDFSSLAKHWPLRSTPLNRQK